MQPGFGVQPQIINSGVFITENSKPTIEFTGTHKSIALPISTGVYLTDGSILVYLDQLQLQILLVLLKTAFMPTT